MRRGGLRLQRLRRGLRRLRVHLLSVVGRLPLVLEVISDRSDRRHSDSGARHSRSADSYDSFAQVDPWAAQQIRVWRSQTDRKSASVNLEAAVYGEVANREQVLHYRLQPSRQDTHTLTS
jgi:hypothetical protein